jgi:hypothetical protein
MENFQILNQQKNDILSLLLKNGMIPTDFRWLSAHSLENDQWSISAIRHEPTGHHLAFDRNIVRGDYMTSNDQMVARLYGTPGVTTMQFAGNFPMDDWQAQLGYVDLWIKSLKAEIDSPDLWGAIYGLKEYLVSKIKNDLENTPFTSAEITHISKSLGEIKSFLLGFHPEDQQRNDAIEASIKTLETAAGTQGRRDWTMFALSILITLGISYYFSSANNFEELGAYASHMQNLFSIPRVLDLPVLQ